MRRPPSRPEKPEPVQIDHLVGNPFQPRLTIDIARLGPLIESIREFGFMGHIEARHDPLDTGGRLQIIFGHRRVRAAALAGLTTIPVAIVERDDEAMRRAAYIENATQEPLSYWEEGVYFQRIHKELGLSMQEIGALIGKSKGYVQNRLDVLRLPEGSALREAAEHDEVVMTAALALLNLNHEEQEALFHRLQAGEITVDDLKALRSARSRPIPLPDETLAGHPASGAWTAVEHARWILRQLESSLPQIRRHATRADFSALDRWERTRLGEYAGEVAALLTL